MMADPTPYDVEYSFSSFQANSPSSPLPAGQLDNELANIQTAVNTLVDCVKDLRRADGALKNGIVTYDSLALSIQTQTNPVDIAAIDAAVDDLVANAAVAVAAANSATLAAADATTQALAAAASASSVDLALYLSKAGNLNGLGDIGTARANLDVPKKDGSDITGRLATLALSGVTDWNTAITNGWYASTGSPTNAPSSGDLLVQVMAWGANYVTQIAYQIANASTGTNAVLVFRRHSYDNTGNRVWSAWESMSAIPVGTSIWVNGTVAPAGFLKENGALLTRSVYPRLHDYAAASNNYVTEASWPSNYGAFSSGDLTTTFRLMDSRGEFIRAWDDSRGVDSGRTISSHQADAFANHTHNAVTGDANNSFAIGGGGPATGFNNNFGVGGSTPRSITTEGANSGSGSETRPRNNAKLACIKY